MSKKGKKKNFTQVVDLSWGQDDDPMNQLPSVAAYVNIQYCNTDPLANKNKTFLKQIPFTLKINTFHTVQSQIDHQEEEDLEEEEDSAVEEDMDHKINQISMTVVHGEEAHHHQDHQEEDQEDLEVDHPLVQIIETHMDQEVDLEEVEEIEALILILEIIEIMIMIMME